MYTVLPWREGNQGLTGTFTPPSDKSISHRALLFASLAEGHSTIRNLLNGEDVTRTRHLLENLGVTITENQDGLAVEGRGLSGFKAPSQVLYCGNSGTTMRLSLGLLAAQGFESRLTGDFSLNRRPMRRVTDPLSQMGAQFKEETSESGRIIVVSGNSNLHGIEYQSPVASAQIKSALLLAGLFGKGKTSVEEPLASRDHSERFLKSMGANLSIEGRKVTLTPGASLKPFDLTVPGDPSSAAFFVVAALLIPHSNLVIQNVLLNPTRIAAFEVLKRMGGKLSYNHIRELSGETVGDLHVESSPLAATDISPEEVPALIDEIPILAIACARAKGLSKIRGAEDLRVKESDRLSAVSKLLKILGVNHREYEDGLDITGQEGFAGGAFASDGDHRMAMSAAIAGFLCKDGMKIEDTDCVATSFPGFADTLNRLGAKIE